MRAMAVRWWAGSCFSGTDAFARLAKGGGQPAAASRGNTLATETLPALTPIWAVSKRVGGLGCDLVVSFCLEGPAGTGKSAWARHLARLIGMPVIEKRASDLLSKWVGRKRAEHRACFPEARALMVPC